MIQTLISMLDAAIAQHLPTVKRHGLAELQPVDGGTQPVIYADNGSFVQIANDNSGTFSYWRMLSAERTTSVQITTQACDAFVVTIPMRFVAMVDRTLCPQVQDAARAGLWAAIDADDSIRLVTRAISIDFNSTGVDADSRKVYQQEFGRQLENASKAWVAIDMSVVVTGNPECFDPCSVVGDFLCALIAKQTWQRIKACMTDAQIEAATEDLCDAGPCVLCDVVEPADPADVVACVSPGNIPVLLVATVLTPEATPEVIVVAMDAADKTDEVRDLICTPCGDVEIIDQDDNVIATPACGTQYSVLVFDGIDGGASNTVFTNSIVAP